MFVDLTTPERAKLLSQSEVCFIPGYTGHCPTLKFCIGKRYGECTKQIMKELFQKGVLKHTLEKQYRQADPLKVILHEGDTFMLDDSHGQVKDLRVNSDNRCRRFILGYTGYIPGLNFQYGTSFGRAADASTDELNKYLAKQKSACVLQEQLLKRNQTAQKFVSIRSRDQVKSALKYYQKMKGYNDHHISPQFPPITGYTGHIPRLKGTEASLSQTYCSSAKRGLAILYQEREAKQNNNVD